MQTEKSKQASKIETRIARVLITGAQKLLGMRLMARLPRHTASLTASCAANQTMTLYKSARVLAGCINTNSPNDIVVNPNRLNFQHEVCALRYSQSSP
jgi:hypothetical protein